jgi:hypothetical protein
MAAKPSHSHVTTPSAGDRSSRRVELLLFVSMLVLALVGVGITQIEHTGGRLYWLFLVVVYAGIGAAWAGYRAKEHGAPMWPMVRAQLLHWLGALVAINIVLLFESVDIASRGAAADYSLLILALSCYLSGIYFNWSYMLLGGILAIMAVGLGYLDQLSLLALLVPLAILAVWVFARHRGKVTVRS